MTSSLNLRNGDETFNICLEANGNLNFKANGNNCGGNTRVTINDDSGNVGIGTTNPQAKLHVSGNIRLDAGKEIFFPDNGKLRSRDNNHQILFRRNENKLELREYGDIIFSPGATGGQETAKVLLKADGNVGIGTTNPGAKLEVYGDLKVRSHNNQFRMYLDGDGKNLIFEIENSNHGTNKKMRWDGDTNWDAVSDIRLKTNIEKEGNILSRLMQLEVKNYHWKDNPKAQIKKIGLIAQDVQPLFPSLVGEFKDQDTDESTLTLKYAELGVLAIGGLKELKQEKDAEIANLKIEMNTQISKIKTEMEAEINILKTKIQQLLTGI